MEKANYKVFAGIGVSALAYLAIGYFTLYLSYPHMMVWYGVTFFAYLFLVQQKMNIWLGIAAAVGFRLLLLLAAASPGTGEAGYWWHLPQNLTNLLLLRVVWILCDLATMLLLLRLLRKMGLPAKNVLYYGLNPLVLLEVSLRLHLYTLFVLFLILSLYFLYYQRIFFSGAAFGLAIGLMGLPFLFLPLFARRIGLRRFVIFLGAFACVVWSVFYLTSSQPDLQYLALGIIHSLQQAPFNASFYILLRGLFLALAGYVEAGLLTYLVLGLIAAVALFLAFFRNPNSVRRMAGYMAVVYTFYLLLSPAVYGWQLLPLLALTSLSHFRYAVAWSGLAFLSYDPGFQSQSFALLAVEYAVVIAWLVVELYFYRQRHMLHNLQKQKLG
ncbi:hypothetical protein ACMA1I_11975 [Pontibacter sp. 13R65]|uniref:hypothetical protein n=1 Tax=Pontibacter sp. 13R65 TaxID=3127458 RepID=UPI00301E4553